MSFFHFIVHWLMMKKETLHHHNKESKKVIIMIALLFDSLCKWLITSFSCPFRRWNAHHLRWKSTIILFWNTLMFHLTPVFSLLVQFSQETGEPNVSPFFTTLYNSFLCWKFAKLCFFTKSNCLSSEVRLLSPALLNITHYLGWYFSTDTKQFNHEDDMVSELFSNISESWHALFLILIPCHIRSAIHWTYCKQTLCYSSVYSSLCPVSYSISFHTNYSHKKDPFIAKTGEMYFMTETTQLASQNMIYTMHVWGQSMGMIYANMQYAWSFMIRTNQSITEVLSTRLCVIQQLRSMRGVVTDYWI